MKGEEEMSRRRTAAKPPAIDGAEPFVVIPAKAKPSRTTSTDDTRQVLSHAYLRKTDADWHLISSDSYCLSRIPVHVECENGTDPSEGPIPSDALRHAEKDGGFRVSAEGVEPCSRTGAASNVLYRQNGSAPKPPDWEQLFTGEPKKPFRVGLNTKMLRKVAEALGTDAVELEFDSSRPLFRIRVRALTGGSVGDADGLLMPIRVYP